MISFILIGKNEAKTIDLTIRSIYTYIQFNHINNYEIIYVDSQSTDNSIDIVNQYKEIEIFEITGEMNAAIARNIGAKEAKGDIFIFLDTDMEIQKEFHKKVFTKENKLIYPFVSGQLKNIFYDNDWKKVDENILFPNLKEDTYFTTTGGYFIIEKNLWFSISGMNTKYKTAEDLDLGLRLSKQGTRLLRKKELFVLHHTIDYQNSKRVWMMLKNGSFLYPTSVLYREHIGNKYIYRSILRKDYSMLALIVCIPIAMYVPLVIILYFLLVAGRTLMQKKVSNSVSSLENFIIMIGKDIMSCIGLFLFYPKKKILKYKKWDS